MPAFLILFFRFIRTIWDGLKDPEFRSLFYWVLGLLTLGTWFYARVEGWTVLDALYFSVITLTTVGYGDLYPHSPAGKVFTMIYVLVGLGLISGFIFYLLNVRALSRKVKLRRKRKISDMAATAETAARTPPKA